MDNRLVRYSGSKKSIPKPVISRTNQVLIIFVSSPYVTATGFEITYYVYVYKAPSTTVAPKQTPKPLSPQGEPSMTNRVLNLSNILVNIWSVFSFFAS